MIDESGKIINKISHITEISQIQHFFLANSVYELQWAQLFHNSLYTVKQVIPVMLVIPQLYLTVSLMNRCSHFSSRKVFLRFHWPWVRAFVSVSSSKFHKHPPILKSLCHLHICTCWHAQTCVPVHRPCLLGLYQKWSLVWFQGGGNNR